ncbi:MAG: cupin domain-containing protein [Proteobacteria bacterium]|nr:cupin domain-containing protein [Pseudomonadota bacterium]
MTNNNESKQKKSASIEILTSVSVALVLGWLVFGTQSNQTSAQQSNFQGGSPSIENSDDVSTLRLVFPAGVRSSWHTHSWGQLLMVEEGRGLTQDRGGPLLEMHPGEPWWTPAGREHWHGAHPDEQVLQMTIYAGTVDWLDPVTDAVYMATPQRP